METLYLPDADVKKYINEANDKGRLDGIDGIERWIVKAEDGTRYVVSPDSAKESHENIDITENP